MAIDLSLIISIVSVCAAVFFGYQAFARNNSQDIEENATMNARLMTKLDSISEDLKDMKRDSKDIRSEMNRLNERVVILEHDLKSRKGQEG